MYSKTQQTKKNKDKPLKDKEYLAWLHSCGVGCHVCGDTNIEAHHVHSALHGIKKSDHKCILLCAKHHRLDTGCSPHAGREGFLKLFSLKDQLILAHKLYNIYIDQK